MKAQTNHRREGRKADSHRASDGPRRTRTKAPKPAAEAWEDPVCSCEAEPRWQRWAEDGVPEERSPAEEL